MVNTKSKKAVSTKRGSKKPATTKKKIVVQQYSVVEFADEYDMDVFQCIPDRWFVDENRQRCFFPPHTGKPFVNRAINCDKPEDHWGIYDCTIVKGGLSTYSAGCKVVKEQLEGSNASQNALKYPPRNIDHIFAAKKAKRSIVLPAPQNVVMETPSIRSSRSVRSASIHSIESIRQSTPTDIGTQETDTNRISRTRRSKIGSTSISSSSPVQLRKSRSRSKQTNYLDEHSEDSADMSDQNSGTRIDSPENLRMSERRHQRVRRSTSTGSGTVLFHSEYSDSQSQFDQLVSSVNSLTQAVQLSIDKMNQGDRRLNRLEVTVNKVLQTLCDMNGYTRDYDDDVDSGFQSPDLPIDSQHELYLINRKLKDKEFRRSWVKIERKYCCPSKRVSDTKILSAYLTRFISLELRASFTLKEKVTRSDYTLYEDFQNVYEFLIDVIKEGYRMTGKNIHRDEAHCALRVVWGRSRQLQTNCRKKVYNM